MQTIDIFQALGEALRPMNIQQERAIFTAQVIDVMKEKECIPQEIAKAMCAEYHTDIEWSRMFNQSATLCAGRIFRKVQDGRGPIELNILEDDE